MAKDSQRSNMESTAIFDDSSGAPNEEVSGEFSVGSDVDDSAVKPSFPWLRSSIAAITIAASITLPFYIFYFLRSSETKSFERDFKALSLQAKDSFGLNMARLLSAADSMSVTATAQALNSNSTWPFVALRDFPIIAESSTGLSEALLLDVQPFVSSEDRKQWEEEFVPANEAWMKDSYNRLNDRLAESGQNVTSSEPPPYSSRIFKINFADTRDPIQVETSEGPYLPSWQSFPTSIEYVNLNYRSNPGVNATSNVLLRNQRTVMGQAEAFTGPTAQAVYATRTRQLRILLKDPNVEYRGEPSSTMQYPIFDTFDKASQKVVGSVTMVLHWPFYFARLLPSGRSGINAVLKNTCSGSFTMSIDGATSTYRGLGDLHDKTYDELEDVYDFREIENHPQFSFSETFVPFDHDHCSFSVRFYPTSELYHQHATSRPLLISLAVGCFLSIFGLILATYGWLMRRRFRRIIREAVRSGNYVSSIFPEHVRERLMKLSSTQSERAMLVSSSEFLQTSISLPRFHETSIADSYPNCTVFFAKISGFAAWSADREPEQMFEVLECAFQAMDRTARRWKVFKVETIAETYLAVTGLPTAQEDHAWRMCEFARDCMASVDRALINLGDNMGADLSSLKLQIGLHSGAVTAGVMGGQQKARFQVFGDVVNTSSRMMSTGSAGCIHLSSSTKRIIMEDGGRSNEIEARSDKIFAKGKGEMSTYWLHVASTNI